MEGKGKGKGKRRVGRGGRMPQLGSLDPSVEKGRGKEKGNERDLGWGYQALLFFHFKHCVYTKIWKVFHC